MARNRTSFEPFYTEDEKKAALELGARVGRRAAIRQLRISPASFQRWTEDYPDFWSDLKANIPRKDAKTRVAENLEDLAEAYATIEFEALERAQKLVPSADPKELAALIKAMGASRGVATAGSRGYRGEDHDVAELNINFPQLEAAAEAILSRAEQQPALQVPNEAEHEPRSS